MYIYIYIYILYIYIIVNTRMNNKGSSNEKMLTRVMIIKIQVTAMI